MLGRSETIQGTNPLDFCGFYTFFGMFWEEQSMIISGVPDGQVAALLAGFISG
jgi:hypothetical protein